MKVVAILYKGGEAAKQEPRLLGTVENEVCLLYNASDPSGLIDCALFSARPSPVA